MRIMRPAIAALAMALAAGCGEPGSGSGGWRAAPAAEAEWRVYQDVRERRRIQIRGNAAAALEFRLLDAPAFVSLGPAGTLEVAGTAMPVGRHRIVVEVRGPQRRERIEIPLQVMPVV